MKHLDKMNTYLANLALWNIKLHNLHWNVTGSQFVPLHEYTEALYDKVFESYDAVAEHIKIKGFSPLATAKDYIQVATLTEAIENTFTAVDLLTIVTDDISLMMTMAMDIRNDADASDDFTGVALFEEAIAGFEKDLWFIRQMQAKA